MKTLYIFFFLIAPMSGFAQDSTVVQDSLLEFNIVKFPEVEAEFPGGIIKMNSFIIDNLSITEYVETEGRLVFNMIIDAKGKPHYVQDDSLGNKQLHESLRAVVEKMPNWTPAQSDGENVATKIRLPMCILLD